MHCVPTAENHKVWIQGYTAGTHSATDIVTGMGCAQPVYRHCCIESTQFHLLVIYSQDITDTQPISPDHFYLTTLLSLYWHGLDTLLPAISPGCLQILCPQWLGLFPVTTTGIPLGGSHPPPTLIFSCSLCLSESWPPLSRHLRSVTIFTSNLMNPAFIGGQAPMTMMQPILLMTSSTDLIKPCIITRQAPSTTCYI